MAHKLLEPMVGNLPDPDFACIVNSPKFSFIGGAVFRPLGRRCEGFPFCFLCIYLPVFFLHKGASSTWLEAIFVLVDSSVPLRSRSSIYLIRRV